MTDQGPELNQSTLPTRREPTPTLVAFVVLIMVVLGFGIVGPFVGLMAAYPFYDGKGIDFFTDVTSPEGKEYMKLPLMIVQGIASFVGLAVVPFLFWRSLKRKGIKSFFENIPVGAVSFLLVIGIVIFFIGFNSIFIEFNSNLNLPDGPFETWARDIETRATELTKFLTSFTSFGAYLSGVLVVAVIAGFSEELVFRGMLQPELQKMTGNIHVGIWLSAIFFSALHLQFYGFLPRVLLGALFGYLYYWSGSLLIAMFAHFVNNFLAVTAIYAGLDDLPGIENTKTMPWYLIVIFTALFGILLYNFYKIQTKPIAPDDLRP